MSRRRVVVTGLGATTPIGGDVTTSWSALLAGTSGVRNLTEEWAQLCPLLSQVSNTTCASKES